MSKIRVTERFLSLAAGALALTLSVAPASLAQPASAPMEADAGDPSQSGAPASDDTESDDDAVGGEDLDGDGDSSDDTWEVVDEPDDFNGDADDDGEAPDDGMPDELGSLRAPPDLPVVARRPQAGAADSTPGNGSAGDAQSPGSTQPGGGTAGAPAKNGRSFGGVEVRDGGAPWQAEIYRPFPATAWPEKARAGKQLWELQHWCGGSLIAKDWVLTAAHCVDEDLMRLGYRVRLGAEDVSRDAGTTFRIVRAVVHPGWNDKAANHMYFDDIALLQIAADGPAPPLNDKQIRQIPVHRGPPPADGTPVTSTGWGKTRDVEGFAPNAVLLKVDLNVISEPRCASIPEYGPEHIHSRVICAGAPTSKTCRGDSGGPVVFKNGNPVLVGVVSWGKEHCTGNGEPGVYTRVGAYAAWIDSVLRAGR